LVAATHAIICVNTCATALWQVFDEKQAEEIFKMLLVTPLCNALL
jgi:hypothetical protein